MHTRRKTMVDKNSMTISELSRLSKLPASTIRYYLRKKLIAPPHREGKTRAYYNREHLTQLNRVKKLRAKNLSISEIRHKHAVFAPATAEITTDQFVPKDRKDAIINEAIKLFRGKGYDSIIIDDIVEKARISKSTFYKHFSGKEDLFYYCADKVFENIDAEYIESLKKLDISERFKVRLSLFIRYFHHMIDMLNIVRSSSLATVSHNREKLVQIMANLTAPLAEDLEEGILQGIFRKINTNAVAHMLMGTGEYGVYFCEGKNEAEIDKFISGSMALIMKGLPMTGKHTGKPQAGKHKPLAPIKMEIPLTPPAPVSGDERTTRSDERRNAIISVSIDLFVKHGLGETSVDKIANTVGIGKGTFYKYFKDKNDLFIQCADTIFHKMYRNVWQEIKNERDMFRRLARRGEAFLESFPEWIDMMNLLRHASVGGNPLIKEKFKSVLEQIIRPISHDLEALQREGKIDKNIDCLATANMLMGMMEYCAWITYNGYSGSGEIFMVLLQLINNGLGKNE